VLSRFGFSILGTQGISSATSAEPEPLSSLCTSP
jgi:cobalamin biosynthesis protein CbiD